MPTKRKILVFIDWYLPGFRAGGPIQSCANLVEHLRLHFDFYIVTRDTDYCETTPYKNIKSNQWNTLADGEQVYYISKKEESLATIKRLCKETDFDFLYLNGVYSLYFSILPLYFFRNQTNKKMVVATRGMFARGAMQVKRTKKSIFLRASKLINLYSNVSFQASNEAEACDIKAALGDKVKILIAANLPKRRNELKQVEKEKVCGKVKLINIARIAPEKNLKFALQLLAGVKAEVEFDFYGPIYQPAYFEECLALIKQLPANVIATYKGSIEPEKVNALFQNYHALFMPSLGENFGHIILEAFVAGCPVVISNKTPWNNLESRKLGFEISLQEQNQFVQAIERLANMPDKEYIDWSSAAFLFGKDYVNNPEILKQNLNLFKDYTSVESINNRK